MVINWIIHNPSNGTAWIDIQPEPINDADYKTPIAKAIAKGSVEIADLPGAARMPFEIKLPTDVKIPAELYTKDQTKAVAADDGKLNYVVTQALARYVATFTPIEKPEPPKPPDGVDEKLVDLVKQSNADTKKAITQLLADGDLKTDAKMMEMK